MIGLRRPPASPDQQDDPRRNPQIGKIEDPRSDILDTEIHEIGHMPVKDQPVKYIPHTPGKDQAEPNHSG
jgi:hypothetical protein